MSQRQYLYVDDTNRAIQFSQNDWVFTSQASRDLGLRGVFKDTLAATVVTGATIRIEFQAAQIVIVGATVALPGAQRNSGPLSSFVLDGSNNSAFVFRGDVSNATAVPFFVSPSLSEASHVLEITVLSATRESPFLFDQIALLGPEGVTTDSSDTWATTTFAAPIPGATQGSTTGSAVTEDSGLPVGAIVGGVIGGVALLVATALAIYFLCWRRRRDSRYGSAGFSNAAMFNGDREKVYYPPTPADAGASQAEPFLQHGPDPRYSQYSDYPQYPASSAYSGYGGTPHASEFSATPVSPPLVPPPVGAPVPVRASQAYPPAPTSVSSAYSNTTRTLSVVNETEPESLGALARTLAQRKAEEAMQNDKSSQPVQYHADSGVRFDSDGQPIEPGSSASEASASNVVEKGGAKASDGGVKASDGGAKASEGGPKAGDSGAKATDEVPKPVGDADHDHDPLDVPPEYSEL
ncbi:hypothetical protein C8Q76DRAFT_791614 [Earliella scabrosa]|nr:hypothetical protein C8Q76DRAFT_791614 [Earliella scabrosa]